MKNEAAQPYLIEVIANKLAELFPSEMEIRNDYDYDAWRCALDLQADAILAVIEPSLATLKGKLETAREIIENHAQQFEFYESQHRAKNTPEADAKAEVNRALSIAARSFLATLKEQSQ